MSDMAHSTHEDDGLSRKTWMQLRQCTRLAMDYLRGEALAAHAPESQLILAEMEKILSEGSTDDPRPAWYLSWRDVGRDRDRNLILEYKPSGGRYHVIPEEDL